MMSLKKARLAKQGVYKMLTESYGIEPLKAQKLITSIFNEVKIYNPKNKQENTTQQNVF